MSADEPRNEEPTRDDLLDNTPEAVAMRRAREARAREAERRVPAPEGPRPNGRRKAVIGVMLAAMAAARILGRSSRIGRR